MFWNKEDQAAPRTVFRASVLADSLSIFRVHRRFALIASQLADPSPHRHPVSMRDPSPILHVGIAKREPSYIPERQAQFGMSLGAPPTSNLSFEPRVMAWRLRLCQPENQSEVTFGNAPKEVFFCGAVAYL